MTKESSEVAADILENEAQDEFPEDDKSPLNSIKANKSHHSSGGDGSKTPTSAEASGKDSPGGSSGHKPSGRRRKISLPWFRQSSFGMSFARLRLPKQHTIASSAASDEPVVHGPTGKKSELTHVEENNAVLTKRFVSTK